MKKIIISILIPILVALLMYLMIAFVTFDFNLGHLQASTRVAVCFFWLVFSIMFVAMYCDGTNDYIWRRGYYLHTQKNNNKKTKKQ